MRFDDFRLGAPIMDALRRRGFEEPTPIQEHSIPPLLQGRDLLGIAQTGSGKTLAFGLPLLEKVDAGRVSIQALVICPTRELAQQVSDDLADVGKEKGVRSALVVGGVHVRTQRLQIPGRQVVVGTPGRIVDLLEDRFLPVEWVEYLVLDEFDRLLEMGFIEDIRKIVARLPRERQTALFSATAPQEILRIAGGFLKNPVMSELAPGIQTVATVTQRAVRCPYSRKLGILCRLLRSTLDEDGTVVVFCNTKREVRQLDRELWARDFSVAALSGDHEQSVRFKVMERFRNREIRVLVATDVAARGLDIDHIAHVINWDVPSEVEDYVHRIGRTARAGREGMVTSLVGEDDVQSFNRVKAKIDQKIEMLTDADIDGRRRSEGDSPAAARAEAPRRPAAGAEESRRREESRPEAAQPVDAPFGAGMEDDEVAFDRDDVDPIEVAPAAAQDRDEAERDSSEGDGDDEGGSRRRRRRRGRGRGRGRDDDSRPAREPEAASTESRGANAPSAKEAPRSPERPPEERSRGGRDGQASEGNRGRSSGEGRSDRGGDRNQERRGERGQGDRSRSGGRERNAPAGERGRETGGGRGDRGNGRDGRGNDRSGRGGRDASDNRTRREGDRSRRDGGDRSRRDGRTGGRGQGDDKRGGGPARSAKTPEAGSSGETRENRRGDGRRPRHDYRRWEEEQLNKPVELIEDNGGGREELDERLGLRAGFDDDDSGNRPVVEVDLDMALLPSQNREGNRSRRGRSRRGGKRRDEGSPRGGSGDAGAGPTGPSEVVW